MCKNNLDLDQIELRLSRTHPPKKLKGDKVLIKYREMRGEDGCRIARISTPQLLCCGLDKI